MYVSVDIIEYIALEEIFMISKISVEDRNLNSVRTNIAHKNQDAQNPAFKGGVWALALQGIQECEKNPMVNVAVIDMFSAILPRTFVESMTNWFAGFEAFRRESSGLIVNCLIPSAITWGVASGINKFVMQDFREFCRENKEFTQKELLSMALIEYMNKYRKRSTISGVDRCDKADYI